MKYTLEFNANGTWIRCNDDVVSEGAGLAMLNGYVVLNQWVDADKADKYRLVAAK